MIVITCYLRLVEITCLISSKRPIKPWSFPPLLWRWHWHSTVGRRSLSGLQSTWMVPEKFPLWIQRRPGWRCFFSTIQKDTKGMIGWAECIICLGWVKTGSNNIAANSYVWPCRKSTEVQRGGGFDPLWREVEVDKPFNIFVQRGWGIWSLMKRSGS